MAQDSTKLPAEVIRVVSSITDNLFLLATCDKPLQIVLAAARRNQSTAVILARTCKAIYAWVTPVLYSTVVLTTKGEFSAFEYALHSSAASFRKKHGSLSRFKAPLGTYVRNLWLGQTRSKDGQHRAAARVGNVVMLAGGGNAMRGGDIWDHTLNIVTMCTSIRALALANFPPSILQFLLLRVPTSLESLTIRLGGRDAQLDIPNLSRLTSLRRLTFLDTHIGVNSLVHMLQLPSLRTLTRLCDRCSESLPYAWPPRHALTYLQDSMSQLTYLSRASEAFERLAVVSLLHCDLPLEERLARLEAHMAQYCGPGSPSTDGRVVVSAKDARDEFGDVDGVKTLYDDWIAGLDPCNIGCAQYTQQHVSNPHCPVNMMGSNEL